MQAAVLVATGGALGALARYAVGLFAAQRLGLAFPYGTLAINVSGCFLLGLFAALALAKPTLVSRELALLLGVGFCGAYTTFSTFGLETLDLVRQGAYLKAGGYVLASNLLGLLAVFAGYAAARGVS